MAGLGALWAGLLVVGGALLAASSDRWWPGLALVAWLLGATVIAAGEYVFVVMVGDRLFPGASRSVVAAIELTLGIGMAALALGAGLSAIASGGDA